MLSLKRAWENYSIKILKVICFHLKKVFLSNLKPITE